MSRTRNAVAMSFVSLAVSCSTNAPSRASIASAGHDLVGSWKLVNYEGHSESGEVTHPFGPSAMGCLTYAADGRMAVQIMDPRRPTFRGNDFRRGEVSEIEQAFEGYFAYFGTYTVDEAARTVTHNVAGALYPNYIGRSEQRFFTLEGDALTLRTPPRTVDGVQATFELRWVRENHFDD